MTKTGRREEKLFQGYYVTLIIHAAASKPPLPVATAAYEITSWSPSMDCLPDTGISLDDVEVADGVVRSVGTGRSRNSQRGARIRKPISAMSAGFITSLEIQFKMELHIRWEEGNSNSRTPRSVECFHICSWERILLKCRARRMSTLSKQMPPADIALPGFQRCSKAHRRLELEGNF